MISIIIPAFNEEESISKLIHHLKSKASNTEIEIIVSDGGSTDKTQKLARESGAVVVESPKKGRACQMNFGAKKATGTILYFLHADSYPPESYINDIKNSLAGTAKAGCFRLSFDYNHTLLQFYSWFTRFDIDYFRFGDQSLFIKKELFEKLSGFDEKLIVMEDQMFVRRVKLRAEFEILNKEVVTSARKYRQVGIIKLQLIFSTILILFYLGVSQDKLVSFYKTHIT